MADSHVQDELTRLRLKILEQKIRAQSSGNRSGNGVPYQSTNSAQQLLQAETLKSQQLLQTVKEERQSQKRQPTQKYKEDDNVKDMMTMMMAQNMQLQQVVLQQMMMSTPSAPHPTEKTEPLSLPNHSARPVEIEQIGHREMTPFTTLPNNRNTQRAEPAAPPPKIKQPVVQRKPSPKPLVPRGVATPVRSTERVPELPTRPRTSLRPEGFLTEVTRSEPQSYPFPGPRRIRKLRHVAYVAWACCILITYLKKAVQRRLSAIERLDTLIHQAIEELHGRHYLNSDASIRPTLEDAVKESAFDLKIKNSGVFQKLSRDSQAALTELSSMVETVVYNVIQIKSSAGLLSATREGVLWEMSQVGVLLPPNYLWQVEKDHMKFTDRGEVAEVTSQTGVVLLLGLFISRGLVSTLLLSPTECGLVDEAPSKLASSNLKVLGSIFMRLVRDVCAQQKKKTIMPLASEINSQLLSDDEMKFVYKKLEETFIWCRANIKRWAEAYVDSVSRS